MTTYKEIKGTTIQNLAADLASSAAEGQIWFNTVSGDLKTIVKVAGTWSTGGNLNQARSQVNGAGDSASAALAFGGTHPPSVYDALSEEYDGSSWTEGNNLSSARFNGGGCGSQTAALAAGGALPPSSAFLDVCETYNGTSWTEVNDLNTGRNSFRLAGTSTAAIGANGVSSGPTITMIAEQWDGTNWTEVADLNTTRYETAASESGTSTAAIIFGGVAPPGPAGVGNTESWDGSSWTEIADLNNGKKQINGAGTQTAAYAYAGYPGNTGEYFDGTSWTEIAQLSTTRWTAAGAGTLSSAFCAGGDSDPGNVATTEEWSWSSTLKTGAWASGGNLPNPASTHTAFGPGTAGVHAGGELSGASNAEAFHYDGTSWTGGGNINQTRNVLGGYGTQTSGAIVGGHMDPTPTTVQNVHETYDGTTWSEAGDLQTGRAYFGTAGCGTTTAALVMAGLINPELNPHPFGAVGAKNESEEYNGTSWAEGNNVNTARVTVGGAGTQTAALLISGNSQSPNALKTEVESYDGTSWTEVGDVNTAVDRIPSMAGGTQDIAIKVSGRDGTGDPNPATVNVEQWDGTSWAEVANVSSGRHHGGVGSAPSASSAFLSGGTPPATNATEEWTLEQNIKTIAD